MAPTVRVSRVVHDFGTVGQGDNVRGEFTLTNGYSEPIEIKTVLTGCSCQIPVVSRKHLAPGQETKIEVVWLIGSRRGAVTYPLWVLHTIPNEPTGADGRLELRMAANVIPDIEYAPTKLAFEGGRAATERVALIPGRLASFRVRFVYSNSQAFSVRHLEASNEIEVRYTPNGELDYGTGLHIAVETDSKHEPTMRIPISVRRPE